MWRSRLVAYVGLLMSVWLVWQLTSVSALAQSESIPEQNAEVVTTDLAPSPTPSPEPTAIPAPTHAVNLTVSPISLVLETDPGTSVTSSIRILNNASETEYLRLDIATFEAASGGSQPRIRPFANTEPQQQWLSFSEQTVVVRPGEWKTVGVTFSPPAEAALSYYYAIVVKRQAEVTASPGDSVVTGAPAILVLSTVHSPNARRELQLESFSSKQKVYEFLPTEFAVVIKNTGNIHVAPFGDIFIESGSDADIAALSFNPANGMILPGSTRTYTVTWADGFPLFEFAAPDGGANTSETGSAKKRLVWDFSRMHTLRLGKFTAQLLMVYDNGERDIPVESAVSFWVIPWRFLAVATVVLLFLLLGIFFSIKSIVRLARSRRHGPTQKRS